MVDAIQIPASKRTANMRARLDGAAIFRNSDSMPGPSYARYTLRLTSSSETYQTRIIRFVIGARFDAPVHLTICLMSRADRYIDSAFTFVRAKIPRDGVRSQSPAFVRVQV